MIGCLVIHGYTGGPYEIKPLIDYLQEKTDWKISVPILPGHGEQLALDDITYDQWLAAARMEIETLMKECETVYVIGFSMGGMIAAYLAANYEVEKLVLLAPARHYISVGKIARRMGEVLVDVFRGTLADNDFYVKLKAKKEEVPVRSNVEFTKLVRHTKAYLKDVHCPVLMIHGQEDSVVPVRSIKSLDKEMSSEKKQIVVFDRADHMLCLGKNKDIVNKLVYHFLIT